MLLNVYELYESVRVCYVFMIVSVHAYVYQSKCIYASVYVTINVYDCTGTRPSRLWQSKTRSLVCSIIFASYASWYTLWYTLYLFREDICCMYCWVWESVLCACLWARLCVYICIYVSCAHVYCVWILIYIRVEAPYGAIRATAKEVSKFHSHSHNTTHIIYTLHPK